MCFRPDNFVRLLSPYYGRSDLAAEYYDSHIFHLRHVRRSGQAQGEPISYNQRQPTGERYSVCAYPNLF